MTVEVTLKDTQTNATATYLDVYATEEKYEDSFMWTDGNYACDCNRYIFFYGNIDNITCGAGRFEVIGWNKWV